MRHRCTVLIVAIFSVTLCGARDAASQERAASGKPVKVVEFHIDGRPLPPASWDELWNRADIVVEGIIQAETALDGSFTAYELQLVEVYKGDSQIATNTPSISVTRMGGVRDKGSHIEKRVEEGFPLFERGEHYILFLQALSNGRYTLSAEGAFLITPSSVQPRGRSSIGQAYDRNPELLRLLLRGQGDAR